MLTHIGWNLNWKELSMKNILYTTHEAQVEIFWKEWTHTLINSVSHNVGKDCKKPT